MVWETILLMFVAFLLVNLSTCKLIENCDDDIDKVLWRREKYWPTLLFTLTNGFNNPNEWYALNREGYRK